MERKRNFDIHFLGLKNKIYSFDYDIDSKFFEMYENSPISKSDLKVKLQFDKKDSFFMLQFEVDGFVNVACDRCNEPFDYELLCDFETIVKLDEKENDITDEADFIYISRSETSFNVADIIYDYVLTNIPMQVFHPNDENGESTCDPEMLERLKIKNNKEDEIDPRWASLSNLKS